MATDERPTVLFEERDVEARAIAWSGGGVLLCIVIGIIVTVVLLAWWRRDRQEPAARAGIAPVMERMSEPKIQSGPRLEWEELHERNRRVLAGSTWQENGRRITTIPIDDAIRRLVSEGMPPQGDVSDLRLYSPRAGSRETGFDLATQGGGQR